jgi:aspartate aminotransferase-like enzyme
MPKLTFRKASGDDELRQICALNHRIFAEEVAQHPPDPSGLLVDRFHQENRYFVALEDSVVVGMISAHTGPEFSIARRLPDPSLLGRLQRPMEIRLLAIEPKARRRTVLAGLLWQVYEHANAGEYSHLLISGITEREGMYRKMGFVSLGPAVPEGSACFVPMMMPMAGRRQSVAGRVHMHERHWQRRVQQEREVSLLPGPVNIHPLVAATFMQMPESHRSEAFVNRFAEMREHLQRLGSGMEVAVFPGGGTLANDAVAANLSAIFGEAEGLVVSNGEFGERLGDQAARAGLKFRQLRFAWGDGWSMEQTQEALRRAAWVWAVHLETSTGVLNDAAALMEMAERCGTAVALDCVSSIGAVKIPQASDAFLLASGVSGKSLGAYAGLGFVYAGQACAHRLQNRMVCGSFDVLAMARMRGPGSTVSSPLVNALLDALRMHYGSDEAAQRRLAHYESLGRWVRTRMRAAGWMPIAPEAIAAPNVSSFVLPDTEFAARCRNSGYRIAHESQYLKARGWGQIATMGEVTAEALQQLFAAQ